MTGLVAPIEIALSAESEAPPTRRARIKGLLAACVGNLIEWFDFFIYAYLAIYFAPSFFPAGDQTSQLIATAGVFAAGFFMRPLGGWLFGWLADTRGRRLSMIISVAMMSLGSLMIAIVPTYQTVGIAAPILLLAARLVQGLSVGAEYGSGATYISEVATKGSRGFYGSFQYATIIAGQLLALLLITSLQQLLLPADLKAWGWRIPFFIGSVGAVAAVFMRFAMTETASKKEMHTSDAGSIKALMNHKGAVALVLAFTAGGSLYFYTFTTYMQKFLVVSAGMSATTVSFVMAGALVCFMVFQPIFGTLSDRIGVKTNMLLFTGLSTVFAAPILYRLHSVQSPYEAFGLIVTGLLILSFYTPLAGVLKADLFPAKVRCLGVGFPYAIANASVGGTAEYVALSLRSNGVEQYFFYYVTFFVGLAFVAAIYLPDLLVHGYLDGDGAVDENIRPRRKG